MRAVTLTTLADTLMGLAAAIPTAPSWPRPTYQRRLRRDRRRGGRC